MRVRARAHVRACVCVARHVVKLEKEIRDECVGQSEMNIFCMQVQFPLVYIPLRRVGYKLKSIVTILTLW